MITAMRRLGRACAPEAARLAVAQGRRMVRDHLNGDARRMARRADGAGTPPFRIVDIVQPIRNTAFAEGKLANIRLGASRLDGMTIAPGEIFSFWALVGRPSARAGFAVGRSIRAGLVAGEIGGGLCQVSGIVYELLLRAGLDPLERHPHSRDLYTEEDRFTPLGLDATVVWPYRDVRFANALAVPVTLRFAVETMELRASLHAPVAIVAMDLAIERIDHPDGREVRVTRNGVPVSRDRYALA